MAEEELKREARQKALEWDSEKINGKYNRPPMANWYCYEKGYLAGAEPREKRLTEAKELLQSVVHQYRREGVEGYIVEEIEAFLKE